MDYDENFELSSFVIDGSIELSNMELCHNFQISPLDRHSYGDFPIFLLLISATLSLLFPFIVVTVAFIILLFYIEIGVLHLVPCQFEP